MATFKPRGKKIRLIRHSKQTKWAPFWTGLKKYGKGRRVHPSRHTQVKRSWIRSRTKA